MPALYLEETCFEESLEEVLRKSGTETMEERPLKPGKTKKERDGLFLFLSILMVDFVFFTSGCGLVWISPVLSKLKSNDTELNPLGAPVTSLEVSLIAGLPFLGCILGPLLVSNVVDQYGRKKTFVAIGVLQIISFLILAFARNIYLYYLSRFLFGTSFAAFGPVLTIYLSEITSKHNRGKYGYMTGIFLPLGNLYAFILGTFFSLKVFTLLCVGPAIISIICLVLFVPESPVYLISRGDIMRATSALQKFRNRTDVKEDLEEIELLLTTSANSEKPSFKVMLKKPVIRRALQIAFGIILLQLFSGGSIIMAFLGPIFDSTGSRISGNLSAILVGVVKVCMFTFASVIVEKSGRRPLLLISTIFASIPLFILGIYFHLKDVGCTYIEKFYWLPVTCVIIYIISYALGVGPAPLILTGEVFPNSIKSLALSFVMFICTIISFLVHCSFPFFVEYLGMFPCFCFFGGCCILGAFFVYFVVPETKGKSLLEIQEILSNSR